MSYPKPIHWWVDNVLPLVYSEALSYMEVVGKITEYVNGLTTDMTTVKDQIEAIEAEIEQIDPERIADLLEEMDTLETLVGGFENRIEALESAMTTVGEKVSTLEGDVDDLETLTGSLESSVQNFGDRLGEVEESTADFDERIATAENLATTASSGVAALGLRVDDAEAKVEDIEDVADNFAASVGESEEWFTATRDYTSGELVYVGGSLYKAIANITSGDSLVIETNISATTVSDEIVRLNGESSSLDGRLDTAESHISVVEAKLYNAERDIYAVERRLDTAENDIDAVEGRLDTAESDIDAVDGRLDTAESDIEAIEGRLDTAESDIDAVEGRLDTAESDIEGVEGRIDTAESDIDTIEGRLDTADSDINNNSNEITFLKSAATSISNEYTLTLNKIIVASTGSLTNDTGDRFAATENLISLDEVNLFAIYACWTRSAGLAFYDINLNYISGVSGESPSGTVDTFVLDIPPTAAYFRFTNRCDVLDNSLVKVFVYNNNIGNAKQNADISLLEKQLFAYVNNDILLNVKQNIGFCNNNNVIDNTNTTYRYTDMIACSEGQIYNANHPIRFVTYYNSKGRFADMGESNPTLPITVPAGASFLRFTYNIVSYPDMSIMIDNTSVLTDRAKNIIEGIANTQNVLNNALTGKTIATFGDSIMYGAGNNGIGIGDIFATKYGMQLHEYSVSGATMGVLDTSHSHIADQVNNAINDNITPDIIIFDGGTNDMNGTTPNCPLGNMSSVYTQPSSETTFSDGFEMVAYRLKTNFPNAFIIYLRTGNISSRLFDRQIEYGQRAIDICHKWAIAIADVYNILNTNIPEFSRFLNDTTHPNADGYNQFYIPELERQIIRWFEVL